MELSGSQTGQGGVLVVEDERDIRELLKHLLEEEGFSVQLTDDGHQGLELARSLNPDVVVLDIGLPTLNGIEVCRQLRTFSDGYVLMLTAKDAEVDKLVGLSVGADDYMIKPFSSRELVARINALLRRPRINAAVDTVSADSCREFGSLKIDPLAHEVHLDGEPVGLTRTEFDLLDTLTEQPRVTFTRGQLIEHVWGVGWFGDEHVVDVHISNLRTKIKCTPGGACHIRTVRGVGYRAEVITE